MARPPKSVVGCRRKVSKEKIALATRMRKQPTPAERKLREYIGGSLTGCRCKCQSVLYGWIADFWFPSRRLIVEADGGYHTDAAQQQYDLNRDVALAKRGILTVRFPNEEILRSPAIVATRIRQILLSQPFCPAWNKGLKFGIGKQSAAKRPGPLKKADTVGASGTGSTTEREPCPMPRIAEHHPNRQARDGSNLLDRRTK